MTKCIYKITNTINDKIYIGQTVRFKERMKEHFFSDNCTGVKFKNAIKKYGSESFICEIIEEFDESLDDVLLKLLLDDREQFYLDLYKPFGETGYNLQESVGHTNLGRKWNDEFKKKVSDGVKKYHETHDNAFKGRTHTEESKKKMSDSLKGRVNHTEESKQKLRDACVRNNNLQYLIKWEKENGHPRLTPIVQLDKNDGTVIKKFSSIKKEISSIS